MRKFIVLVKATADSEAGVFPKLEAIEAMQAFNERLGEDGMWIDGAGLKPSSDAARIAFGSDGPSVTTGPFALTPDLVSGYWFLQAESLDALVARMREAPFSKVGLETNIEIRPLFDEADFAEMGAPGE